VEVDGRFFFTPHFHYSLAESAPHLLSLSLPPLSICLSLPPLPSLTTRASVRRHGCCCLVTIAISLCNTRNSAAWTIAIHPSIKQTLLGSIKPTAVYQYRCHQHRPTSAHQHRHRHPFQYRYRATRRSLAPLNPVHPFDFLETPPRASTRYDPSLSLLLPLHIAACPPIVCLPSYCCRCCHHQISITTTAASNCHH
jgi:hypothetical protein